MKKIISIIRVMGVLMAVGFCLSACNRELDVQKAFPFKVETMSVRKDIGKGETVEIRCRLVREGRFDDARYTIRYFQSEGDSSLHLGDSAPFLPNDRYPLTNEQFRLYYTSHTTDRQTIDIYIEDNFGQMEQLIFDFNNKRT